MGAVAWAMRQRPVSHPRSSNRTCRFPAFGFPTGFTERHTESNQPHAANAQLAHGGVRQELDVLDAAPELVENRKASDQQSSTISCWFDTFWRAIKQAYAQRMFEIGNGSRNDRLRTANLLAASAMLFHSTTASRM